MNISLPDNLKEFIQSQVSSGEYATVDAYVEALVEADSKRRGRMAVEEMVLEGLRSGPPREMTSQDWDRIREEGLARVRHRRS